MNGLGATRFNDPRPFGMHLVGTPRPKVEPGPMLPRDISSRFGRRLRQLRQQHQMTQLTLAVEFGIDRTFISDVERGRKSIGLPTMEVLALGFKMSLSDLLRDL